jgi:cholesterol transport system auxiliary component
MKPVCRVLVPLLLLAVSGCSGLTTRDESVVSYVLRPAVATATPVGAGVAPVATTDRLAALSLKVMRVVAQPGYAGDRILLLGDDRSLGFFAASRWVDALPSVVGTLAVESLRGTARLAAVHDENAPFSSDYTLRLTIRRFDAEYPVPGRPPRVTIGFECAVGRRTDRATLASFGIEARSDATDDRMRDVVAAFEAATQQALADVVRRTLEAVAADAVAAPAATGSPADASKS